MKYKTLIDLFEKYADEEVSVVIVGRDEVCFFPVSDGDKEIAHLGTSHEEPFRAELLEF